MRQPIGKGAILCLLHGTGTGTATLYRDNTEYRETGDSTVPKVLWGSDVHAVAKGTGNPR